MTSEDSLPPLARSRSRSQRSILTAATALALTLVNGLVGIVVMRLVLVHAGSDFNGINATANQFVSFLLVVEAGFTLATNVALLRPTATGDLSRVSAIVSATRITFRRIGLIVLGVGTVAAVGYTFLVRTQLPAYVILLTLLMAVAGTAFSLVTATPYSVLAVTEQWEYVLNLLRMASIVLSQAAAAAVVLTGQHVLWIRFATMMGTIGYAVAVMVACRRRNPEVDYHATPDFAAITGTKDILVQRITGVLYAAAPLLVVTATAGTVAGSVYAVYAMVFTFTSGVLYAVANAPRMGFGQLLQERAKAEVFRLFLVYESVVVQAVTIAATTVTALIMPFVILYTANVHDANYRNWLVAGCLAVVLVLELIHIPSGHLINLSGRFDLSKRIQVVAAVVLVFAMIAGNAILGFGGVLAGVVGTAAVLATLEIGWVHTRLFPGGLSSFARVFLPNVAIGGLLVWTELRLVPQAESLTSLAMVALGTGLLNAVAVVAVNLLVQREVTLRAWALLPGLNRVVERWTRS